MSDDLMPAVGIILLVVTANSCVVNNDHNKIENLIEAHCKIETTE